MFKRLLDWLKNFFTHQVEQVEVEVKKAPAKKPAAKKPAPKKPAGSARKPRATRTAKK
jgi:hypothetical protein